MQGHFNGPCHVSGNFLPFKGKSHSLSSQAARFFSFAKGKKSLLQRNLAHMSRAIVYFYWFHDLFTMGALLTIDSARPPSWKDNTNFRWLSFVYWNQKYWALVKPYYIALHKCNGVILPFLAFDFRRIVTERWQNGVTMGHHFSTFALVMTEKMT
jgi:hypothetical protein